jgi:hypothetical protein
MQQVLEIIRLHDEAAAGLISDAAVVQWKLEKASTNSPFTITALASGPDGLLDDVGAQASAIKREVRAGLQGLVLGQRAAWMGPVAFDLARSVFRRSQNGIGETSIDFGDDKAFSFDRKSANEGLRTLDSIDVTKLDASVGERAAWGEIRGVMLAAGRNHNKPAIQIKSVQYGVVWCLLSDDLQHRFGDDSKMSDVWKGKTVGVEGRLFYGVGGKLLRIYASEVREIPTVPRVNLDDVLDPDFTSGLDPAEYLRQLHEGELAG